MVSVIMPISNNGKYIQSAIKSVLNQSYTNLELIILNFSQEDNTMSSVRIFNDKRIFVIDKRANYIYALNTGIKRASGKYIAIMDTNNIMHVDRLKVQVAVMETESAISVCTARIAKTNEKKASDDIAGTSGGLIKNPLLIFLQGNCLSHPTAMIRKSFLQEYKLEYQEYYPTGEDFKLWVEIAKHDGQFYVDNQILQYNLISDISGNNAVKSKELQSTTDVITNEILECLIERYAGAYPELRNILTGFEKLQNKELITRRDCMLFFYRLFLKNKTMLETA